MTYKESLEHMKNDAEKRKKLVFNAIKIATLLLVVSLLIFVISLCVSLAGGGDNTRERTDRVAPTITFKGSGDPVIYATLGETVAYRKYVSATDNKGNCTLSFDNKNVDITKAGVYTVVCSATDDAGNTARLNLKVVVKKAEFSYDSLMDKIAAKAAELGITSSMTAEEQVKRIFNYVNSPTKSKNNANVIFTDESNSARESWETDWVEEAYLTLEKGKGDCYSYYSLSKAFFEYFGIENVGIKRDEGVTTQSGTHFWLAVNIGSKSAPEWYYYDATRLRYKFSTGSGCLFTEAQLKDYNVNVNMGFYTHEKTRLPDISTETINTYYTWN